MFIYIYNFEMADTKLAIRGLRAPKREVRCQDQRKRDQAAREAKEKETETIKESSLASPRHE